MSMVSPHDVLPATVRRKVAWRILPLIVLIYIIAYLDRANLGFAMLRMKQDLPWSDEVYGWGFAAFFVGYLLLEIPGALLVEHWSARKWFTRILLTWGVCSMAIAFVEEAWQFYLARFMLGLAEAGFFPGVIVYFTHWFPRADRGRALSGLVLGVPISLAFGARLSGYILEHDWYPYTGWQWVFLIEGAPAVLCGLALPFLMTDRPMQATWLTPAERTWLEETLQRERAEATRADAIKLHQALRQPAVWLLALGIFAANTGGYTLQLWLPIIVKNTLHAQGADDSPTAVTNVLGIMYLCCLVGVFVSGQSSDRTGDRKWHCAAGMALIGVFLAATTAPDQPPEAVWLWLYLMGFFLVFWAPPFWVLPTLSMSASAAAVSIAFINICANLSGTVGAPIVGRLRDMGLDDASCLRLAACCYLAGGAIIAALQVAPQRHGAAAPRARPSGDGDEGAIFAGAPPVHAIRPGPDDKSERDPHE
jgi:ACS family tartrate transporter-like MFS transporter